MVIKETLSNRGFEIITAGNGVEGWNRFNLHKPYICVIDIMMPRKDGISLVKDIRTVDVRTPVIFLTARTQTDDVLKGFEAGGDDYMKKPFSMEELIVRIKSLLRRSSLPLSSEFTDNEPPFIIGSYILYHSRQELNYGQTTINLSQRESDLLKLLIERKHCLLDKRTALLKIWGDDTIFHSRSMDVYITKLRKYLNEDPRVEIINVRGRGYKIID